MAYTIQKGDTLGGLATTNKTSVAEILKLNPTITNPNLIQAGASLNLPGAVQPDPGAPTVPDSTGAADLSKPTTFNTPTDTQTPDTSTPFVSSLATITDNFNKTYDAANAAVTPLQTERTGLASQLDAALKSASGRGAAQVAAEQAQGIPEKVKQLQDLNLTISQKTGEYDKLTASLEGQGRGISKTIISGQQGAVQRAKAAEIGALSSVAAAVQGNLTLAQSLANRAVDLEFQDKQDEIKRITTLLDLNKDNLTSAEKKQAEQVKYTLDRQQAEIDAQKDERKQILSLAAEAAKQGADNATISNITKSTDVEQALQLGASALGNEFREKQKQQLFENNIKTQELAAERAYKQAQIANIQSEINSRGGTTEDAANILAYAQQYASTGQIPTGLPKGTFGLVASAAKEIPQQEGSMVNSLTGIKDSKVPAAIQDDAVKLYNIIKLTDQLAELDKNRVGGVVAGSLGKVFGSNAQGEYLTKRKAIVDEISRMQSGAALTPDEVKIYSEYLPGRFSESFGLGQNSDKVIGNFKSVMDNKLKNLLSNNNLTIYGYSKVKLGDTEYKVGDEVELNGTRGRILPDGSISTSSNFNNVGDDTNQVSSIKLGSKLALKNNNPGNLRYIGQSGAQPGASGFARFSSPEDGVRALYADIESKKAPGGKLGPNSTLAEFVGVYAPPGENDTNLYIQQLAKRLGVSPTTKISGISTSQLAKEIAKKESSSII